MTKLQLLEAFYARLGGKPDELPEPFVLGKAEEAIKALSKELVFSANPNAHLLIKRHSFSAITAKEGGLFYADLPGIIKTGSKFLTVTRNDNMKIEPTNSWDALSELPKKHNHPYYKWNNNRIYVSVQDTSAPANITFTVEHYSYLTLSEFPYELVDMLVNAILSSVMPQEQETKNAKSKK